MEEEEETRFMRSVAAALGAAVVASPIEIPPTAVSRLKRLLGESILRRSLEAIRRMPLTGDSRLLCSVTPGYVQGPHFTPGTCMLTKYNGCSIDTK